MEPGNAQLQLNNNNNPDSSANVSPLVQTQDTTNPVQAAEPQLQIASQPPEMQPQQKTKKKHVGLIIFIIFILIIAAIITIVIMSGVSNEEVYFNKDYQYLAQDEEKRYTIQDAPEDIKFFVSEDAIYEIVDEDGIVVSTDYSDYTISNPENYGKGKKYTISLKEGFFLSEQLAEATVVDFSIHKDESHEYAFNEDAKFVQPNEVTIADSGELMHSNNNYNVNDVIIVGDEQAPLSAYYIVEKNEDSYKIREAALDEIYSDLDIYYKRNANLDSIEYEDAIRDYVVSDIKNSKWFNSITKTVHAEPKISINCKTINDGIEIKVTVKINAGDGNDFMSVLYHDISFTITERLTIEELIDLSLTEWNVAFDITKKEDFSINFDHKLLNYNQLIGEDVTSQILEDIRNNFGSYTDEDHKEMPLSTIDIPTEVPGLSIFLGLKFSNSISAALKLEYKNSNAMNYVIGFSAGTSKDFTPIYSHSYIDNGATLKVAGNIDIKSGLKASIGVSFINTFKADISFEGGIYNKANLAITAKDSARSYSIENTMGTGLYAKIAVNAHVLMVDFSKELYSKEFPVYNNSWSREYPEKEEESIGQLEQFLQGDNHNNSNMEFRYEGTGSGKICTSEDNSVEFIYNNGKLDKVRLAYIYQIDTGIPELDDFLKTIIKFIIVFIDIKMQLFGRLIEYDNTIKIVFEFPASRADDATSVEGITNYDNYYAVKSIMMRNGYTCK